jgi:CheY-like chemotaxis protein
VTTATNGKEAIDALLAPDQNVDLILTDIMMPEVDGMELMRIVQASDKPFRSIPIIVMSTVDDDLVSAKCQEAGAQDYLVKPVRKSQMIDLSRHAQPSSSSEAGGSAWTEERALANGGANAADAQDGSGNTKRLSRISDRKVAAKQARTLTKARAAAKVASKLTEAAAAIAADNVAAAHWRGTPLVAAAAGEGEQDQNGMERWASGSDASATASQNVSGSGCGSGGSGSGFGSGDKRNLEGLSVQLVKAYGGATTFLELSLPRRAAHGEEAPRVGLRRSASRSAFQSFISLKDAAAAQVQVVVLKVEGVGVNTWDPGHQSTWTNAASTSAVAEPQFSFPPQHQQQPHQQLQQWKEITREEVSRANDQQQQWREGTHGVAPWTNDQQQLRQMASAPQALPQAVPQRLDSGGPPASPLPPSMVAYFNMPVPPPNMYLPPHAMGMPKPPLAKALGPDAHPFASALHQPHLGQPAGTASAAGQYSAITDPRHGVSAMLSMGSIVAPPPSAFPPCPPGVDPAMYTQHMATAASAASAAAAQVGPVGSSAAEAEFVSQFYSVLQNAVEQQQHKQHAAFFQVGTSVACAERRAEAIARFLKKRKARNFEKKVRYASRTRLAEARPRVRGQFVRLTGEGGVATSDKADADADESGAEGSGGGGSAKGHDDTGSNGGSKESSASPERRAFDGAGASGSDGE